MESTKGWLQVVFPFSTKTYKNFLPRVIPVASSLISVQHHDDKFWKSTSTSGNDHSVPVKPQFDEKFQLVHFHGTNDGTIAYEGKSPGPAFLGANVDVLPAQR